jgi:hypothetical protein
MTSYGFWNCQFPSRVYVSWWTKLAALVKGKLPVNEQSPNLWHTYFEQLLFTVARQQANRLPENKPCHNRQRTELWNTDLINKNCCMTSQPTAKKFSEHFIVNFLNSKKTGIFFQLQFCLETKSLSDCPNQLTDTGLKLELRTATIRCTDWS